MKYKDRHGKTKTLPKMSKYICDWDTKRASKFQFEVKQFLKQYWQYDIVLEEMPVLGFGSRMRADFFNYSQRIMVECNGEQHYKPNKFFHGDGFQGCQAWGKQQKSDLRKFQWCEMNDVILVDIPYMEWYSFQTLKEKKEAFLNQGVKL